MRQNLMLNQTRLNAAEDVVQEYAVYWDATEELSRYEKGSSWIHSSSWEKALEKQEKGGKTWWKE